MNATSSKLRGGVEEKQENCPSWIRGTRSKATEGVGKDIKKSDSSGMNATSSKLRGGVEEKQENCPSWIRGTRSKATEGVG